MIFELEMKLLNSFPMRGVVDLFSINYKNILLFGRAVDTVSDCSVFAVFPLMEAEATFKVFHK